MKKASSFLLFFFLLFQSAVWAQEAATLPLKATMKIVGTGQMRVAPDLAVVNMTVKTTDMDFNKAVKKLNERTDQLNKKLLNAGFKKEEIKTSQLNVQENGQWRKGVYVDSGFVATQYIELRFKRDHQRMARLMDVFAREKGAEALFHFGFALSDEARQQANDELIRKAIQDAKGKAAVIAKASGVQLGKIKSVVYGQPDFQSVPVYREAMQMRARGAADQSMPEIEVKEIEMQDTITIFWEME